MSYTLHRCDPARFDCTGGGDNPHVCEVDSLHKGACKTCKKYPTDSKILFIVMREHYSYTLDPYAKKTICYRDKTRLPAEPEGCVCPPFELFSKGHRAGCKKC